LFNNCAEIEGVDCIAEFALKYLYKLIHTYTYHSRLITEGVAEASQIFFRDALVLSK
jgi:hypothetical protein